MRRILKRIFVVTVLPVFAALARLFFPAKYLRGRWFDHGCLTGWKWAWRSIWLQRVLGFNRNVPWPCSPFIRIVDPKRVHFHPDDMNNFQHFGCYFSNNHGGNIYIGHGSYIAPNVGIITTNHDVNDPSRHEAPRDVRIGGRCWIGMNSVILPGVELGEHTIVGAGSVVSRSFPEGHCIVLGSPARLHKRLDENAPVIPSQTED